MQKILFSFSNVKHKAVHFMSVKPKFERVTHVRVPAFHYVTRTTSTVCIYICFIDLSFYVYKVKQ